MSKSLNARCIRRWEVRFKPVCDSKVSPHMRKSFLRGVRELGLITAENMVESMAEKNARFDYRTQAGHRSFLTGMQHAEKSIVKRPATIWMKKSQTMRSMKKSELS